MNKQSSAIIVVDMLNDFIQEDGALYCGVDEDFVDKVRASVGMWYDANVPVIFICDNHIENDKEFEMFPPHCIAGTKGAEIIDELQPYVDENLVITKTRYSGFYDTELEDILLGLGISKIGLVGVCTDICVMHTAADARNRDLEVIVFSELVDSFDHEAHEFALKHMDTILGVEIFPNL
jgi:nicotinamidase/pyrazinamidase